MATFAAQVSKAIAEAKVKIRYVAVNAIQDVMEGAQTPQAPASRTGGLFIEGKIPVDTSALINSLTTSRGGKGDTAYIAALAGFEPGETISFTWTMPYAMRIEMGFVGTDSLGRTYNQAGRHMVGFNAARFPEFVAARVKEVE
jgi:hypothetical protein